MKISILWSSPTEFVLYIRNRHSDALESSLARTIRSDLEKDSILEGFYTDLYQNFESYHERYAQEGYRFIKSVLNKSILRSRSKRRQRMQGNFGERIETPEALQRYLKPHVDSTNLNILVWYLFGVEEAIIAQKLGMTQQSVFFRIRKYLRKLEQKGLIP